MTQLQDMLVSAKKFLLEKYSVDESLVNLQLIENSTDILLQLKMKPSDEDHFLSILVDYDQPYVLNKIIEDIIRISQSPSKETYDPSKKVPFSFEEDSLLNLLFDFTSVNSEDEQHAHVKYLSKDKSISGDACLRKEGNTFYLDNPRKKVYEDLRTLSCKNLSIKCVQTHTFGHPKVVQEDGEIRLPRIFSDRNICLSEMVKVTPDYIEFIHYTSNYMTEDKRMVHSCTRYVTSIDQAGKIVMRKNKLPVPEWLSMLRTPNDFIKNPNNRKFYDYLNPQDEPIYDVDGIFVTSAEEIYVGQDGKAVRVNEDWIFSRLEKGLLPPDMSKNLRTAQLVIKLTK